MKLLPLISLLSLALASLSHAQIRSWRNNVGDRSIEATFVSRDEDSVTLKRQDAREVTLPLADLHLDDRAWLKENHPLPGEKVEAARGTAFDNLNFGESREAVEKKLAESQTVYTEQEKAFLGRTGLNGIYQTREKIGGLSYFLYFNWSDSSQLNEVSLHSQPVEADLYQTSLKDTWAEMTNLLSTLHGQPLQKSGYPNRNHLDADTFLASHLWRTKNGHSVLLGTSNDGGRFHVIVRITTERIQPNVTP